MEWEKKGLIFTVDKNSDWMYSHAAVPFAEHLRDDIFRIYFTTRDIRNRSHGAFIDIDLKNPKEILHVSQRPVLKPGLLGSFDDSGAMLSCIVNHQNRKYLIYQGWMVGVTVPFYVNIGMAICTDPRNGFTKIGPYPLFDRNQSDPYFTGTGYVLIERNNWRMWYLSGVMWERINGIPKHYYCIKYAESNDGITWDRKGITSIPFKSSEEYAISRPCVIRTSNSYQMYYSYRSGNTTYRIGYAESDDGLTWTRIDDRIGIDVSPQGWDSGMIEYPFVFCHKGTTYMLYNGNEYGKSGFGYAILNEE